MKAVVLAAGMGRRLQPLSRTVPKGLIVIGEKSLLQHSLDALKENGINDVILVVGFLQEVIQREFGQEYRGLKITYVVNEKYQTTGSMYSLSRAKDAIGNDDIILLESDLLYDPKAIAITLKAPFKDFVLVADVSQSGDEVYICVDKNKRIVELGKNIPDESKQRALGELVGISRLSRGFLAKLFERAEVNYRSREFNYHYEECVFSMSKLGYPVYALFCKNLLWIEIDNKADLKRARKEHYPQLKRSARA